MIGSVVVKCKINYILKCKNFFALNFLIHQENQLKNFYILKCKIQNVRVQQHDHYYYYHVIFFYILQQQTQSLQAVPLILYVAMLLTLLVRIGRWWCCCTLTFKISHFKM